MKNDIQIFYDLMAERVANEWYSNSILLPSIKEFLQLLPPKPSVLDLGCGPGYESMRLASEGAKVVGIDFSEESIRIAKERAGALCPDCRFEVLDFTQLDQRYGFFDGVFSTASLIHIPPEQIEAVIQRISRILKTQGCLLMIIQAGEGINEKMSDCAVDRKKLRRTVYQYTKEQMTDYTAKQGLRFLKEGYLDPTLLEYNWRSYLFQKH